MRKIAVVAMLLAVLGLAVPALGEPAKEFEPGIKLIEAKELKSLLDAKADIVLINTLSELEFRDRALPGSVLLSYEHVEEGTASLPASKAAKLVFY
jgi:hypothetical protein